MQRDTSSWGLPPLPGPFDSDAKLSCLGDSAACAHVCVSVLATRGGAFVTRESQLGPSDAVKTFQGVLVGRCLFRGASPAARYMQLGPPTAAETLKDG